jgi:hypothetical protein
MNSIVQINIRISKDCCGNDRFTKEEIENLIKENEITFSKNLVLRKSDKKIIGEII